MIRKIIALCLVLMAVSFVVSGCKEKDPVVPKPDDVKKIIDDAEDHTGHDHD